MARAPRSLTLPRMNAHRLVITTAGLTFAVAALAVATVEEVTRTFGHGRTATRALRGVTFGVAAGQLAALRARSGSGKTTLLNIVGGLGPRTAAGSRSRART